MLNTFKTYVIIAYFLLALGCTTDSMDNLISEDVYIDLLAELHLLRALENTYPDSNFREDAFNRILLEYNISEEDFEESHEYYMQDVAAQRLRLDEAYSRLTNEHNRIREIKREKGNQGS